MCFASPNAYLYFFPGLARLALTGRGETFYLDQFLFHLSDRAALLDAAERSAVRALLWRLLEVFDGDPRLTSVDLTKLDDCLRKLEPARSALT